MGSREENERAALQVRTVVTPGVCVGGTGGLCVARRAALNLRLILPCEKLIKP